MTAITSDPTPGNNSDSEPTNVLPAFVPAPSLTLLKQIGTSATGPWSSSINVTDGDAVYYQFTITNTGNVALSPVGVSDPKVSTASCTFTDPLPVGGSTTCVVGPVTTIVGTHTNTAKASGGYGGQTYDSNESSATYVAASTPPDISQGVVKTNDANHDGTFEGTETVPAAAVYPYTVTYKVEIKNNGHTATTITSIVDDKASAPLRSASTTDTDCADLIGAAIGANATLTCYFDVTFQDANTAQVVNTITVKATGSNDGSDRSTVNFTPSPALSLTKVGVLDMTVVALSTRADVGDKINYTLTATNDGNVTLTNVTITDAKLGTLSCTPTQPATLAPAASLVCTGSYTLVLADINAGTVHNVATSDSDQTPPTDTPEDVPVPQAPSMTVEKSSDATELTAPQTVTYSYLVTNTGNVTLTGITLSDDNDNNDMSCPATTLAPAATMTCTATHTFTQAELDKGGTLDNVVTADSDQTLPTTDDLSIPITRIADLAVDKTGPVWGNVGDALTYTYMVTNLGPASAAATLADDKCPSPTYVSGDLPEGDGDGLVNPGETWTFTCTYKPTVTPYMVLTNTATVNSVGIDDSNLANNTDTYSLYWSVLRKDVLLYWEGVNVQYADPNTEFQFRMSKQGITDPLGTFTISESKPVYLWLSEGWYGFVETVVPTGYTPARQTWSWQVKPGARLDMSIENLILFDLAVVKTGPEDCVAAGSTVTYSYTVTNTGPAAVTPVVVDDNATPADTTDDVSPIYVDGDTNGDGKIQATETWTYIAEYVVPAGAGGTDLTNTVKVHDREQEVYWTFPQPHWYAGGDTNLANNTDSWTICVPLTVDLAKDVDSDGTFNVGDTATFTLTITNTSAVPVTITALTDTNALSASCTALIGTTLAAGASTSCTYTVVKNTAGTYSNTASVTVKDAKDNPASDTDSKSITVYAPTVSKTANGTYDEVHDWEVFKSVNTASQNGVAGEKKNFTWTVRVDETTHGENYLVTGAITVVNPNPDDPMAVVLNDVLDDGSDATITGCTGGTWDATTKTVTVPKDGTAVCAYSVTPEGDLDAFAAALPASVTMSVQYPFDGGPAYFPVTTISGDGVLNGTYEGWCADIDNTINQNTPYTANVYSSYETIPAGLIEKAYNLDLVNWIINQDYVGEPAGGSLGTYTYGDVQRAIWELIEDNGTSNTSGLGSWDPTRVNQIKAAAMANGEGFVPTCGDFVAVILQPVGGAQLVTIAQVTFASLGIDCAESNAVTAVLNGISFPASADILWTANPINPTATLDDDQKPDWPTTVSGDTTFSYADPQGYTCSTDPAAYTGGKYTYTETNTAVLVELSKKSTATTKVVCYWPSIEVTKTAAPTAVPETGGDVLFTFVVKNTSGYGSVTIKTLTDSVYGTLAGGADCKVGTSLAVGASCTFSITKWVEGDYSGPDHVNVFTATAANSKNVIASDDDDATVDFTNVLPTIEVTKSADPTAVPETGGDVTFTFVVKNTSTEEPVTISSLEDSVYGTLAGDDDCKVGTVLAAGASCTFSITRWVEGDFSGPDHVNVFTAKVVDNDNTEATDTDDATVDFTNVTADIAIVKVTVDGATFGDGLNILIGESIKWRYTVTNLGNYPLSNISVEDSETGVTPAYVSGDTNANDKLDRTETWIYEASDTAITGAYSNTGTAYGDFTHGAGNVESDAAMDTSSYFGADPQIAISKVTVDGATSGDGLTILTGESIKWRYTVTNVGNVPLSNVQVTDSKSGVTPAYVSGDANSNGKLDLTETWIFEASGTAITGSYSNTGTASGTFTDSAGHSRTDTASDGSSYFGADPQIKIVKVTNGSDGPTIITGTTVTWTYTVTNVGNVPLGGVTVTDDKTGVTPAYVSGDANDNDLLDLTETWIYEATGTAIVGAYSNTGTASGSFADDAGHSRTDTATDTSSYTGKVQVNVIKTVDGKDFSGPELTFELRQGAAPVTGQFGIVLETQKANVANNGHVTFNTLLAVGTYQLCEYVPEGYVPSYTWGVYGVDWFKPGYAPGQGGVEQVILVCVNFTVNADGTIDFQNGKQIVQPLGSILIDNQVGQMPRTIGYWKNHAASKESSGGQEPVLDRMLCKATTAGQTITIGLLPLPGCSPSADNAGTSSTYAVRLLNKSTIDTNKKMASDPLFNLAAQLMGYRLNQPFGAWNNPTAAAAADYAQEMLVQLGFTGKASHLKPSAKAVANLNYLAGVLDSYNNDTLSIASNLKLPYPGVYK